MSPHGEKVGSESATQSHQGQGTSQDRSQAYAEPAPRNSAVADPFAAEFCQRRVWARTIVVPPRKAARPNASILYCTGPGVKWAFGSQIRSTPYEDLLAVRFASPYHCLGQSLSIVDPDVPD